MPVEAHRSTYIETVRGCRSHCTYCFYPRSSNVLRVLDVQRCAQLVGALRERGAREVVFLDPTFNHRPELRGAAGCAGRREPRPQRVVLRRGARRGADARPRTEAGQSGLHQAGDGPAVGQPRDAQAREARRQPREGRCGRQDAARRGHRPAGRSDHRPARRHPRRRGARRGLLAGARPRRACAGVRAVAPARHRHAHHGRGRRRGVRPRAALPRATHRHLRHRSAARLAVRCRGAAGAPARRAAAPAPGGRARRAPRRVHGRPRRRCHAEQSGCARRAALRALAAGQGPVRAPRVVSARARCAPGRRSVRHARRGAAARGSPSRSI